MRYDEDLEQEALLTYEEGDRRGESDDEDWEEDEPAGIEDLKDAYAEAKAAAQKTPEVSKDTAEIDSSSGTLAAPERTYRPWGELHNSLAWKTPEIEEAFSGLGEVNFDQCMTGLRRPVNWMHMKKRTKFRGPQRALRHLQRCQCRGRHKHHPIEGGFNQRRSMDEAE